MHNLLAISDVITDEYNILFNGEKPKYFVITSSKWRAFHIDTCKFNLSVKNKITGNVGSYAQLGPVIT
jgi:hypothetical protein